MNQYERIFVLLFASIVRVSVNILEYVADGNVSVRPEQVTQIENIDEWAIIPISMALQVDRVTLSVLSYQYFHADVIYEQTDGILIVHIIFIYFGFVYLFGF